MFWSPIAFSMPAGVSTSRGGFFPAYGASESPFTLIAPIAPRSTRPANSVP